MHILVHITLSQIKLNSLGGNQNIYFFELLQYQFFLGKIYYIERRYITIEARVSW